MNHLSNLLKDESGQGLVEYALIVGLIAIACIAVLNTFSAKLNGQYTKISNALPL